MQFDTILAHVDTELLAVNQLLRQHLSSAVSLIGTISEHIIHSGGKRIRPLILLLTARALGYREHQAVKLAAIIELIHTATLLHDDVVDHSVLRRGSTTANAIWGNAASILVGDFLYSRSFQLMVTLESLPIMTLLADTTNLISEGEVLQLLYVHNPKITEADYFNVINCKTAALFRAAGHLGALIAAGSTAVISAMANYGTHLGLAFQLIDDVLDYRADNANMGKQIGNDLAEGKPTLPLIYALKNSNLQQQALLREAILKGSKDQLAEIQAVIASTGALNYVEQRALQEADAARAFLACLPPSHYKTALENLTRFAVHRDH